MVDAGRVLRHHPSPGVITTVGTIMASKPSSLQTQDIENVKRFEPARAVFRPRKCQPERGDCWVRLGGGAITISGGGCRACGGALNLVGNEAAHARVLTRILAGELAPSKDGGE